MMTIAPTYMLGGRCVNHDLSGKELALCKKLGAKLVEDGLYLGGIDLMGGKLIEVNVCSPGGFAEINEGGNMKIQSGLLILLNQSKIK